MTLQSIYSEAKPKMQEAIARLTESFKTIHTGRASTLLVEDLVVSHYGSNMPLKQLATISTPDATLISISPWDKTALASIETAIRNSGRGLNPTNDGNVVRISLPPMSQERREELAKMVGKLAEECRITLRNIRKEAWEAVQQGEKAGELTEDDKYSGEKELNRLIDEVNDQVATLASNKEKEIKTI